jgi:signal transduction histidine kinase
VSLLLPSFRAASTTSRGIAAACYWFAMTLLVIGGAVAVIIGDAHPLRVGVVLVGFALVAVGGSVLRFARWRASVTVSSAAALIATGVAVSGWELAVVSTSPISTDSYFFSNLTVAAIAFAALIWKDGWAPVACTVALLTTESILALTAAANRGRWQLDVPAVATWLFLVLVLALLDAARRRGRRDLRAFELAGARLAHTAERRRIALLSTAVLHDTVLGDLTALATTGPGPLGARTAGRLADTVELLSSDAWLTAAGVTPPREQRMAELAKKRMIPGVEISVSGEEDALDRLSPEVAGGLLRAVEQALDNVARHASASTVELTVMATDREVAVMVSDDGIGFDTDAALDPRHLGLRGSIQARVEALGGRCSIWSAAGSGTTVLLSVPVSPGGGADAL